MEARSILWWAVGFATLGFLPYLYPALFAHGHTQVESVFALTIFTVGGGFLGLIVGFLVWLVKQWPYFEKHGRVPLQTNLTICEGSPHSNE